MTLLFLLAGCGLSSFDSELSRIDSITAGPDSDSDSDSDTGVQSGPNSARPPQAGELLIQELMINPSAVSDAQGEYVELRNLSTDWLNLGGVVLADEDVDRSELQPVYTDSLLVSPSGLLVVCAAPSGNGGVNCQATINPKSTGGGFVLANSEDEVLVISATGQTLDTVRYAGPSVPTGAALGLRPSIQDTGANDLLGNWCAQVSRLSSGDAGTPGANNDSC